VWTGLLKAGCRPDILGIYVSLKSGCGPDIGIYVRLKSECGPAIGIYVRLKATGCGPDILLGIYVSLKSGCGPDIGIYVRLKSGLKTLLSSLERGGGGDLEKRGGEEGKGKGIKG
jgi:hypothetical protein